MNDIGKIAVLLPDLRGGGTERMRINLAREWLKRGLSVDFVVLGKQGQLLDQVPAGARVIDLKAPRIRNSIPPLARYLRNEHPTALLSAMWPLTVIAPVAARLARFHGCIAISEHSIVSESRSLGALGQVALRASTAIGYRLAHVRIGISGAVVRDMASFSGLRLERFSVIHNPAANARSMTHPLQKIGNKDTHIFLAVGNLIPVKGHDLVIRAFSRIADLAAAKLYILGEGPERARLQSLIHELSLDGRVQLIGYVEDVASWYASADTFVLGSHSEGFGNVIVEALEHGKRVISTANAGATEILESGKYGILTPLGDEEGMADAMKAAMQDHSTSPAVLRQRAKDFDVSRIADAYLSAIGLGV